MWKRSIPILGSIAERYLRHRHCVLPPADGDLRFLPASEQHQDTMVARITDAYTAAPISLHFTPLNPDMTHGERKLLGGHRKKGGVIRLWPDEAVTHGLAIAEGIETSLCAAHLFQPIWSSVDAGNLKTIPLLTGIESLTIFADNDPAGIDAAQACATRWRAARREVRVRCPNEPGTDAADVFAHEAKAS